MTDGLFDKLSAITQNQIIAYGFSTMKFLLVKLLLGGFESPET